MYIHIPHSTKVINLIDGCHDVSMFGNLQVVDLSGVRVQVIQEWWVIVVPSEVGTTYLIRVCVGTQATI